jgi:hypothetical protein
VNVVRFLPSYLSEDELPTSYLVRLYPHSDSGVAHDLKLFAIVGEIMTARSLPCPQKSKFNDIVGRMRLEGLVHQLGNVIVIESGHFDR